jgi:U3 small nucleolar RNA-associated protein 13
LAISSDEKTIVSAGADSVATFWEDATEVEQNEKNEAIVKSVQAYVPHSHPHADSRSEQDFTNYIALKDYRRAILLALAQSQPGRLLKLFTSVLTAGSESTTHTGSPEIDEIIRTLPGSDLVRLLKFVRDWNANARTSPVAQGILHAILRLRTPEDIIAAFDSASRVPIESVDEEEDPGEGTRKKKFGKGNVNIGIGEMLEGLIPYSERHYSRLERLVQDSYVLDYVVSEMDGGVLGGEVMDIDP